MSARSVSTTLKDQVDYRDGTGYMRQQTVLPGSQESGPKQFRSKEAQSRNLLLTAYESSHADPLVPENGSELRYLNYLPSLRLLSAIIVIFLDLYSSHA